MKKQMCMLLAFVFLLVGCGGQERERTRKAEMKDAFYSVWGFICFMKTQFPRMKNMWKTKRIWFITPSRCIKKQADFW